MEKVQQNHTELRSCSVCPSFNRPLCEGTRGPARQPSCPAEAPSAVEETHSETAVRLRLRLQRPG
eukprot:7944893-Pyramimonas_sp.AAC.1